MKQLIFIAFLVLNVKAQGQTRNFKGSTQSEMNINANAEYEKMDSALIDLCQQILKKNNTDTLFISNFKKAQDVWLLWRSCEIDAFYPSYPDSREFYGSMQPLCYYSKLMDWTEERIKHLKVYAEGVEEEDSCGPARN